MTYKDVDALVDGQILPISAKNSMGELVIIERGKDDCGQFYAITTVQRNDWCRINTFYEDGTITETYEK